MNVGYGIDSATGDVRSPKCVKSISKITDDPTGDTIRFSFRGVEDTKSMHKMLDVSAGASWSGFGVHLSTHADYASDQTLSSYEAAYVLKVSVDRSATIRLDPSVEWDESLNGRKNLEQLCGDSFIERIVTGGKLFAVFRVDKSTFQQTHGSSVNVEGGGWGAEIELAVKQSVAQSSSSGKVHIDLLQIGGTGTDWTRDGAPMNATELAQKATSFPAEVDKNPAPFSAFISPWAEYFPKYSAPSDMDVENAQRVMQTLMEDFESLTSVLESINYVETHQNDFDYKYLKSTCLDSLKSEAVQAKNLVQAAYDIIRDDYKAQPDMPVLPDASCLPSRTICKLGHFYHSTVTGKSFQ